ncbi:hypothetical protein BC830DRAFT_1175709 [Chytriomyces sp. MP71]|nr:hypothetical protein BC830DRAFT_1175709 [Chytriomyces sp. MP71]
MGRNRLEREAAGYISDAFAVLPNLRELRMPQNGIWPDRIAPLLQSLGKHCSKIEILDLQDNTFTKSGAVALAAALPAWAYLRTLNVGDCLLGKAGSKVFFKALTPATVSPIIETLHFTCNEMDLAGAKMVPGVIGAHKGLKTVWLNGNTFSAADAVVNEIRAAFRANGVTDSLDELEDMEEEDSDAEEGDEQEDKEKPKVDDVDALADALSGGLKV